MISTNVQLAIKNKKLIKSKQKQQNVIFENKRNLRDK